MNELQFVEERAPQWERFSQLLSGLESGRQEGAEEFPALHRQICRDLALATSLRFDVQAVARLNTLALRGHRVLYNDRRLGFQRLARFWLHSFPAAVRAELTLVIVGAAIFYGAFFAVAVAIQYFPELVHSILDYSTMRGVEEMYDPSTAKARSIIDNFNMLGYYIYNNISIGFRSMAGGIFFGVGSLFLLIYNALALGAITGHLLYLGFYETFIGFVIAHGALELNAIVLMSVAGLRLGWALVAPEAYTRTYALRHAAEHAVPLGLGGAGLLVVAAAIEAFWSPLALPFVLKMVVGILTWLVFLAAIILGVMKAK